MLKLFRILYCVVIWILSGFLGSCIGYIKIANEFPHCFEGEYFALALAGPYNLFAALLFYILG